MDLGMCCGWGQREEEEENKLVAWLTCITLQKPEKSYKKPCFSFFVVVPGNQLPGAFGCSRENIRDNSLVY